MVRFETDRQKLSGALQVVPRHWLKVSMAPVITCRGVAAEAGDLGVVAHLEDQRIGGRAVGARLEQSA